ncbi:MAG: tetratricopeptide repeat protein [bacterium]
MVKFEKQVELAPTEVNPYDSLGDGYRAARRLQEAAEAYRKALQIDPEFEPSKKKLKEVLQKLKVGKKNNGLSEIIGFACSIHPIISTNYPVVVQRSCA